MPRDQKMSFDDACSLVDDDLPDGAYWAMVHDFAGIEYGEGFSELRPCESIKCPQCGRRFEKENDMQQHLKMMRANGKHKTKGE